MSVFFSFLHWMRLLLSIVPFEICTMLFMIHRLKYVGERYCIVIFEVCPQL